MTGLKKELHDVVSKNIQIKTIDFGQQKPEVSEKVFTKIRKNKIIVHDNYFQDLKEGLQMDDKKVKDDFYCSPGKYEI